MAPTEEIIERRFWDRPLNDRIPFTRGQLAFGLILVLAALLRFWDLGSRMLHHDESLHAVFSWQLYNGQGYRHDPMMHGPLLFILNAFAYFLFGVTDATARIVPATLGTLMVVLPYFLRRRIGYTGAILSAFLLTISPSLVYFSRFLRHDIYQAFLMLLLVVLVIRYLDERRAGYLFGAAACTSLLYTSKEDTYFLMAIVLSFLLIISRTDILRLFRRGPIQLSPAGEVLVLLGTLILPTFGGLAYFGVKAAHAGNGDVLLMGVSGLLGVIGLLFGARWNRAVWLRAAAIFWIIFVLLYTTFLSNPAGVTSGLVGGLRYWIDQQGVARGNQPWYYYLLLLPLYEYLAVSVGLGGVIYWLKKRNQFASFLIYWCFLSQLLWGWASEKMPWMVIELALPFLLLSGMTLGVMFDSVDWRTLWSRRGYHFMGLVALAILILATILNRLPSGGTSISFQREIFSEIALVAAFAGVVALLVYFGSSLGRRLSATLAATTFVAILVPLTFHTMIQASFYHGDVPVEMIVYTQTAPDVGVVMDQINELALRTGEGTDKFQVTYDSGVSWPFEWYLRDYKSRVYIGNGMPPPNAPVILVGYDNDRANQVRAALGSKYVEQRFRLRWWFPEDYRTLNLQTVLHTFTDPAARAQFWKFLIYRTPYSPLGSTDFAMFVRRDLALGPWAAPQAGEASATDIAQATALADKARAITATKEIGSAGSAPGQFNSPKGIAAGPDGSFVVVDTFNQRIEKFDAQGKLVTAWGSKGSGPGQFNEPWGVAIDASGNIYVADTWNHRIQKFSPDGKFMLSWGKVGTPGNSPGQFFGPRGIAIDGQGNVYVTDTGNHRIQKFNSTGTFLAQFGERGSAPGFFDEPVGIALDPAGNIYIADTWNKRIQKLSPDLKPLAQWAVDGWNSQSVVDKPYLAVSADGYVYVTDPEDYRVIAYTPSGQVAAVWGKPGTAMSEFNLPTGLAVNTSGQLLVTDSQNNRVIVDPAVR